MTFVARMELGRRSNDITTKGFGGRRDDAQDGDGQGLRAVQSSAGRPVVRMRWRSALPAAVVATVQLTADGSVHRRLNSYGDRLRGELQRTAADLGIGLTCEGFPSAFWVVFDGMSRKESDARAEQLGLSLRDERLIQYHHTWLPSAAHDDEALQFTVQAFAAALSS